MERRKLKEMKARDAEDESHQLFDDIFAVGVEGAEREVVELASGADIGEAPLLRAPSRCMQEEAVATMDEGHIQFEILGDDDGNPRIFEVVSGDEGEDEEASSVIPMGPANLADWSLMNDDWTDDTDAEMHPLTNSESEEEAAESELRTPTDGDRSQFAYRGCPCINNPVRHDACMGGGPCINNPRRHDVLGVVMQVLWCMLMGVVGLVFAPFATFARAVPEVLLMPIWRLADIPFRMAAWAMRVVTARS